MSAVLYECPVEGCISRLFAEPGGTKLHCRQHTDTLYVQVEQYEGPNFEYVDPREGKGKGATHVQTGGVQSIKTVTKEPEIKADDPEKVLEYLRDRYRMLFDAEADKRLGIPRLRTLVKAEEQRREEAEKAKSQAKNQDDEDEYEDYDEEEYEEDVEEDTEEE